METDSPESDQEVESQIAHWYRKAAEQGDPHYQCMLGQALSTGYGVPQDWAEAADWFRKSAEQGNADAQVTLGICYWNAHGVSEDRKEAARWFRLAADQDDVNGLFSLGLAHFAGVGTLEEDHAEAAYYFRRAAECGHPTAQFNLSVLYGRGDGVGKDLVEAYKWAALAAAQSARGAEDHCLELASELNSDELQESLRRVEAFQSNISPAATLPERPFLDLLRKFAEGGDIEAQQLLVAYCGDKAEAMKWVRRSAEQGSALAQHRLGESYLRGVGVEQNYPEAIKWYRAAAEQGLVPALYDLGRLYSVGIAVSQNYFEAYRYANLASACGDEDAIKLRDEMAAKLTLRQIARAKRSSHETIEQGNNRQPITSEVRREVWRRDGGKCVKCGSREKLEYDHIIPVTKGGSNTVRNIELLCESCNRSKSAAIQ